MLRKTFFLYICNDVLHSHVEPKFWKNYEINFVGWKNVRNFALSKNGASAFGLPVQMPVHQIGKHVGQLSVGGRNVHHSREIMNNGTEKHHR